MGICVFLVEDEADLRELWGEVLRDEGFVVVSVADVKGVRAQLAEQAAPFDVAIVDWTLPDGSGAEVTALLRASGAARRIVIATGLSQGVPADHGADEVLTKPFPLRDLLACIGRLGRS